MRILAVDDEAGALKILCRAITAVQPEAELASFQNGAEALAFLENWKPDIAFLDIRMPEISGLELAKKCKRLYPTVNIIFATSYSDCALEAMRMHSSGYLLKPVTTEDVRTELQNLRNPISESTMHAPLYARTFGNFDLYSNGKPVAFHREKSKELLAYLIDCQGSSATRKQIAAAIFEDGSYTRSTQAYLSQIIRNLSADLKALQAEQLLLTGSNTYAVDISQFQCDAYDYFQGKPDAINAFHGEYMLQYSWGENRIDRFYE